MASTLTNRLRGMFGHRNSSLDRILAAAGDSVAPASAERRFGYDATEPKGRRRVWTGPLRSEDDELPASRRGVMHSQARDVVRNFSAASWAVRKHLDFVSRFTFDSQSGIDALDVQLEALMGAWSEPDQCDVCGRHGLDRWLRIFEARAFVDGDVFAVMLSDGRLQAIEADRVRSPNGLDGDGVTQGVKTDRSSRALEFAVHRRTRGSGFEFERWVRAQNILHHGYFDRFDQVRGISPTASGLNNLQDVYENFDYALAKAKISQIFGLKFTRDAQISPGVLIPEAPLDESDVDESDEEQPEEPRYAVDYGRGPLQFDMDTGEDVNVIESANPSTQFQEFTKLVMQVGLKAADIPYCFYDESHTNFYGSRAAVTLYVESCDAKRRALKRILRQITLWKIRGWVARGKLVLPAGMTPETVPFEWIHAGLPWWDPSKEVNADNQAVKAGFRSRREIRKERYGDDWFAVVDQLAEEEEYARQKGVVLDSVVVQNMPSDPQQEGGAE